MNQSGGIHTQTKLLKLINSVKEWDFKAGRILCAWEKIDMKFPSEFSRHYLLGSSIKI